MASNRRLSARSAILRVVLLGIILFVLSSLTRLAITALGGAVLVAICYLRKNLLQRVVLIACLLGSFFGSSLIFDAWWKQHQLLVR